MPTRRVQRTVNLPPRTKARPRLGRKRRAYTPVATINAEKDIAEYFEGVEPFDGPVQVTITYRKDRQKIVILGGRSNSGLRGDIDNYVKLTLDALQRAGVIPNDRQVVELIATKE